MSQEYLQKIRIMIWNNTKRPFKLLGTTLMPKGGRARSAGSPRPPRSREDGLFVGYLWELSPEDMKSVQGLVNAGKARVGLEYIQSQRADLFSFVNWTRLVDECDRVTREKERLERERLGPAAPPVLRVPPKVLEEEVGEVVPVKEVLEETQGASGVVLSQASLLDDLNVKDLTNQVRVKSMKIKQLRDWGKAFDPPITGTKKAVIASKILDACHQVGRS